MRPRPVLIVDDEPEILRALRDLLEANGFPVREASNGSEALDALADEPLPGLVLVDLRMPVMSGWELVEVLRTDPGLRRLPVVVLSADLDGRRLDVTAFLSKPVHPEHLLAAVEGHYQAIER
jgi:two-component system, chemotaxis family, chemotaxis protein CheY